MRKNILSAPFAVHGFSLIELLVVIGISAATFTGAALAIRSIAINQQRSSDFMTVPSGAVVMSGTSGLHPSDSRSAIDSYTAPNVGRAVLAEALRTLFFQDVEKSLAVYVLPRAGNVNAVRPNLIPLGPNFRGTPMEAVTPDRFRGALIDARVGTTAAFLFPTAANTFVDFRGSPPRTATVGSETKRVTNATVFLMGYSNSSISWAVRNIYEIDYVAFEDPTTTVANAPLPCVLGSVRRFAWVVSGTGARMDVTDSYDIIYRDAKLEDFGVAFAHFERGIGAIKDEGVNIDRFKRAANQPFYMMWWPDPVVRGMRDSVAGTTRTTAKSNTYGTNAPQNFYWEKENTTSLLFVFPQFPAL